jgi:nucleoid DNA-binding protein
VWDSGAVGQRCCRVLGTAAAFSPTENRLKLKKNDRQQLIEKIATKTELGKAEVEVALDSVLELIAGALRSNERVDIRGFGSFVVKDKKERQGRTHDDSLIQPLAFVNPGMWKSA